MDDINEFANVNLADIPEKKPEEIRIGGIIRNVNTRYDKKNRPWAIVELNGSGGKAGIFVFNDVYEKTKEILTDDSCVFIKGSPSNRDDDSGALKMIAGDVFPLSHTREKLSHHINVILDSTQCNVQLLYKLNDLSEKNSGLCELIIHLKSEAGTVQRIKARRIGINASKELLKDLRKIFGQHNVWFT